MTKRAEELVTALIGLATRLGPGARVPTVRSLCAEYGVAMATMQEALERVEEKDVIRREHGRGIFVSAGLSPRTIALVAGVDSAGGFSTAYMRVARVLRAMLEREGYALRLFGSNLAEVEEAVRLGLVCGAMLYPEATGEQGLRFARLAVPTVRQGVSGLPATFGLDYHAMIRQGVKALAEAHARRIACVSLFNDAHEREKGVTSRRRRDRKVFEEALVRAGLSVSDARFVENDQVDEAGRSDFLLAGAAMARQVFAAHGKAPDGVLILDDNIASGFLQTALLMGFRPGRDFACVTHENGDSSLLRPYHGFVRRLVVRTEEFLEAPVRELLKRIAQGASEMPPARYYKPKLCDIIEL